MFVFSDDVVQTKELGFDDIRIFSPFMCIERVRFFPIHKTTLHLTGSCSSET